MIQQISHAENAQDQRKRRRHNANLTGCSCGFFALMLGVGVMNLTEKLFLPGLAVWLILLPLCSVLVRKTGKGRPLLYAMRAAGITLLVLPCIMTFLCVGFSKIPALYRIRRFIYREGVRDRFHSGVLMPEQLPDSLTRYEFHARVQAPAQDYSPDAVLILNTDQSWLHAYEDSLAADEGLFRHENTVNELYDEESGDEQPAHQCPELLPRWVYDPYRITDDLQHAVFYLPQDAEGKTARYTGAMINYETGLLIVWA